LVPGPGGDRIRRGAGYEPATSSATTEASAEHALDERSARKGAASTSPIGHRSATGTGQIGPRICDVADDRFHRSPVAELAIGLAILCQRQPDRVLIPSRPMETAIEQLDIPPDRSFSYDGRFITSRVTGKDGTLLRELRYDAGLADWVPMPIKHGKRKGGIRVVIRFTPVAGSPRNNEMFDVAASDADAVTAWLDRLVRRH
jgi:hypothetical protein